MYVHFWGGTPISIPQKFTAMWWLKWSWWYYLFGWRGCNMLRKKAKILHWFHEKDDKQWFSSLINSKYWQNIWLLPKFCVSLSPQMTFIMKNYSQDIMDYALSHPQFGLHELYSYLDKEGNKDISHKTVSWYLTKLIESGKLQRVAHGKYDIGAKQQFLITPTDEQFSLNEELKQKWPFANFCIYNGSVISPLQHHLSANNITYIEYCRYYYYYFIWDYFC